jgi:hypothetical protein
MNEPEEAFAKLVGRQATDKDRQALYRARDALSIKSTDSLWILLIALQHYEALYERIPQRVSDAARESVAAAKTTAEAQAKAAAEETRRALTEGVRRTVDENAKRATFVQILRWSTLAALTVVLALVAVGRWEFHRGEAEGTRVAEGVAVEQRARAAAEASWANTADGWLAYEFARVGSLRDLASCSGRGLVVRDGWCIAQGERGRPARWRLPEGGGPR